MESYMTHTPAGVSSTLPAEDASPVSGVDTLDKLDHLTRVVEQLTEQVGRLQKETRPTELCLQGRVLEMSAGRPHGEGLPTKLHLTAGKLTTSGTVDQPPEGEHSQVQTPSASSTPRLSPLQLDSTKGAEVVTLQEVEELGVRGVMVADKRQEVLVTQEKNEVLWDLVENSSAKLDSGEEYLFFTIYYCHTLTYYWHTLPQI